MKFAFSIHVAVVATLWPTVPAWSQPLPVPKTNPKPVYMHYMPWFQTPLSLGGTGGSQWGWHWKMNTQNPNTVDASGKRQIASHYYPKIGPYDSSDPNVIEYHLLLMKYSGIDGLMIDWYGIQGTNGDIGVLRQNSEAMIRQVDDFGLKFGVVLEDRFASSLSNVQANVDYLRHNPSPVTYPNYPGYFENPAYIRVGAGSDPLMMTFGPINYQQPSQWTQILSAAGEDVEFLTLQYESGDAGANADGEYAWPYQDGSTPNHLAKLSSFLGIRAPSLKTASGLAYPGFHDFYQQGGAGSSYFYIPENNGQTLADTLYVNQLSANNIDMIQLATFNDYGEGTMFEPTVETGFNYLHQIQSFTGTSYGTSELQLIYEFYLARKKYAGNSATQSLLDQVATYLSQLQIGAAQTLLSQASPAGDYNADGQVTITDYSTWRAAFGSSKIIYGSGADGNYDGVVNAADFVIWRNCFAAAGGGFGGSIPEPRTGALIILAAALCCCSSCRRRLIA